MTTVFQVYAKDKDTNAIIVEDNGVATLVKWGDGWDHSLVVSTIRVFQKEVDSKFMSKTEFRRAFPKLFKQVSL